MTSTAGDTAWVLVLSDDFWLVTALKGWTGGDTLVCVLGVILPKVAGFTSGKTTLAPVPVAFEMLDCICVWLECGFSDIVDDLECERILGIWPWVCVWPADTLNMVSSSLGLLVPAAWSFSVNGRLRGEVISKITAQFTIILYIVYMLSYLLNWWSLIYDHQH